MIRLGLDLHGVIDVDPKFFVDLSDRLLLKGHEVHIITGREDSEDLHNELKECGMETVTGRVYHSILSITTYQKALGTPVTYLDNRKSQPIMEPSIWNPTKATLCASAGIHIMIDDSTLYEPFFRDIKTQYITYTPEVKVFLQVLFNYEKR